MSAEAKAIAMEAIDIGMEEMQQEVANELRPDADAVRQAAAELTQYASTLMAKNSSVAAQLASLNTESESSVLNFSKQYVKSEQDYLDLMDRVFRFQNTVNEFLGQKIIMTFVAVTPVTGKVTLYNMENSIKDLNVETRSNGDVNGRLNNMRKIKAASSLMENSQYDEKDKQSLDMTFQEVWQRYRISKAKLALGGPAFILWKIGEWDGRWINSAGPLGEAYVAFFVNKYRFSNEIEPSVMDFMTNKNFGAANADNASGFLKGDIVNGAMNFGVKMKGAQPMQYTEVIKYAEEIQHVTDITSFLVQLKEQLDKGASNLVKPLEDCVDVNLDDIESALLDRMAVTGKTYGDAVQIESIKVTRKK